MLKQHLVFIWDMQDSKQMMEYDLFSNRTFLSGVNYLQQFSLWATGFSSTWTSRQATGSWRAPPSHTLYYSVSRFVCVCLRESVCVKERERECVWCKWVYVHVHILVCVCEVGICVWVGVLVCVCMCVWVHVFTVFKNEEDSKETHDTTALRTRSM
jgi:hypothetical protein